jgi:DNA-binding CsgD family transcriptional regulator
MEGDLLRGFIRSKIASTESGLPSGSGSEALLPKNPLLWPVIQEAARRMLEPTALSRAEAVDDDAWYRSDFFRQFRAPQGLDDCILSVVPLPGLQPFIAIICLSGPLGGSPEEPRKGILEPFFNARQRRVIEIAHAELRWIYYPHEQIENEIAAAETAITCFNVVGADKLSPRLQKVLQSLLRGASEKEVAGELGLSKHTIHEYVRAIYRTLGVASRSELMAQLMEREV